MGAPCARVWLELADMKEAPGRQATAYFTETKCHAKDRAGLLHARNSQSKRGSKMGEASASAPHPGTPDPYRELNQCRQPRLATLAGVTSLATAISLTAERN